MNHPRVMLSLVVASLCLFAGCQSEAEWEPFSNDEGDFTIDMPGTPEYQPQELATEVGPIEAHGYVVEANGGRSGYFVQYSDLPPPLALAPPAELLEAMRDGVVEGMNFSSTSSSVLEVEDGEGIEFKASGQVQGLDLALDSRIYMHGLRVYLLMVLNPVDEVEAESVSRFFDSFEVTDLAALPGVEGGEEVVEEEVVE